MITNKQTLVIIVSLLFFINKVGAQPTTEVKTRPIAPPHKKHKEVRFTKWSIKAGANIGVLYLSRNTKDRNNEPGYSGGITRDVNDFVRVSGLYTYFKPFDILPTWEHVKGNTYEINLEIIARFPNKKTLLYPFVGLSYNTFSGFFTGKNDYLNLRNYYTINSTINNNWLGINLGSGLEHSFGILGLYIDYRMRIGKEEKAFNIMDVCYTTGIKVRFPYGKLAKKYSGINDRYNFF